MIGTQEVREVKRQLDGRRQVFICRPLSLTVRHAIVSFVNPQGVQRLAFSIPAGSITYGFFWRGRSYTLYRMLSPQGELIAHRFDVVDEVRVRPQRREVEYLDLLLDVWVAPDGTLTLEDEDEVVTYITRGRLTPHQEGLIARTRQHLLVRHPTIIAQAGAELAASQPQEHR